jgi:hypothetical protein
MEHDRTVTAFLRRNRQWVEDVTEEDPNFFIESAKGQHPKILWIGCSDSRVPEAVVTASRSVVFGFNIPVKLTLSFPLTTDLATYSLTVT